MTKQLWIVVAAAFGLSLAGAAACGPTTVTGKDCAADCDRAKIKCIDSCGDDPCKEQCNADLKNCSAQCDSIQVQTGLEGEAAR